MKNFGSKSIFGTTNFWSKNFLILKYFVFKNDFDPKMLGLKNFGSQNFGVQKKLGKIYCDPKILVQTILGLKYAFKICSKSVQ